MRKGSQLIIRYRRFLGIPNEIDVTNDMIYLHWELEKKLANTLRQSKKRDRWKVTTDCYREFYNQLPWLKELNHSVDTHFFEKRARVMSRLMGTSVKRIYEIGSGTGRILSRLAGEGHLCRGMDIFTARGLEDKKDQSNLTIGVSDGVHLDRFERTRSFDVVFSENVIEHLHPDDLFEHFQSVYSLLDKGGKYILKTPHVFSGPHGLEKIFGLKILQGFHLKEYSYCEIRALAFQSGFRSIKAVVQFPFCIKRIMPRRFKYFANQSAGYMEYLCTVEKMLLNSCNSRVRKLLMHLSRCFLIPGQVFVVLYQ